MSSTLPLLLFTLLHRSLVKMTKLKNLYYCFKGSFVEKIKESLSPVDNPDLKSLFSQSIQRFLSTAVTWAFILSMESSFLAFLGC